MHRQLELGAGEDAGVARLLVPGARASLWQPRDVTRPTVIDLFSGAGGASFGLVEAGFDLRLSVDVDPQYALTHQANLPGEFIVGDLRAIEAEKLLRAAELGPGELDLLFAGPPCQGFSIMGSRTVRDERNSLFGEVLRVAETLQPRCVVVENVPGLTTLDGGTFLQAILEGLADAGYDAACAELLAAQYGAPQMRWRLVVIGWREDLDIPGGHGFPHPTVGPCGVGDLLPNCTITAEETKGFVTARDALSDLPTIAAGEQADRYSGRPRSEYQRAMRAGLRNELWNHYAARLSEANLERIRRLAPGQDWRDLPQELLPEGMRRALRKDHTRRYRRMSWDGVPRAVITRFRDPKTGEYTHPEQHRTISIREAARLQGFPDRFVFYGTRSSQYEQVGNAVPTQLATAVGAEVRRCLGGRLGARLLEPFRRRPVPVLGRFGQLNVANGSDVA